MIKNSQILEAFERESFSKENLTLEKKYAILEGMYEFARQLDQLEKETLLDGVEADIELARMLHLNVQKPSH
jgi:hypothetical protein